MSCKALVGARIFTGADFRDDQALIIAGGVIGAVMPAADLPADLPQVALDGGLLAPGFIDVQVNGGGGVLFNDQRTVAALARLVEAHARHGTTALLPTLITDQPSVMAEAQAAVTAAQAAGVPGIIGLHLEGPFLAPARAGAHDPALIRPLTEADADDLLACPIRPLVLTLAPDVAPLPLIRRLAEGGITVSIGHSDASYEQALAAVAAGARGVTHLFNAMSPLGHRAPGVVGAALDCGDLWGGVIADGYHVHPAALRVALAAKHGPGRLFLVSDAMSPAGTAADSFTLNGRTVRRRDGRLTLADGTLAGSDLTLDRAVRYAVHTLGLPLAEALRMACLYPAQFLKIDHQRGRLAPGLAADLVLLDDALRVRQSWIAGQAVAVF